MLFRSDNSHLHRVQTVAARTREDRPEEHAVDQREEEDEEEGTEEDKTRAPVSRVFSSPDRNLDVQPLAASHILAALCPGASFSGGGRHLPAAGFGEDDYLVLAAVLGDVQCPVGQGHQLIGRFGPVSAQR